ncbi:unnamed protein product [marine sediment metagenome]|uniref:Uncharacterized protein n=1 Tax=marine sediment metagenome TaxID=412755 RepID=X1KZH0_9ZZZZ
MSLQEELDRLYKRIGDIKREMASRGGPIYGPPEIVETIIEDAARMFERVGMGPVRTMRYKRAITEVSRYGPLGFLQRDAERIRAAITRGLPFAPMPTGRQQTLIARANKLAQDIIHMPLEDARRARESLKRIAREVGVELQY